MTKITPQSTPILFCGKVLAHRDSMMSHLNRACEKNPERISTLAFLENPDNIPVIKLDQELIETFPKGALTKDNIIFVIDKKKEPPP